MNSADQHSKSIQFRILLVLLAVIPGFKAVGQRYLSEISDSVSVETVIYATKDGQKLDFDIYRPAYDSEAQKATIIYLHGGGFSSGDKKDGAAFCKHLAQYGYAALSLNYRLTRKEKPTGFGCECEAKEKILTIQEASRDLQDAIYFLIQNREHFGLDPYRIILAGSSAGAHIVLNTAYMPPSCYGLEKGPVSYAGVIAMAGAVSDTIKLYADSAIPSLLFHGTCDDTVPYGSAAHRYCPENKPGYLVMYGSSIIAEKLKRLKTSYRLFSFCGGGHEWASKPMTDYFDEMISFCYDVCIQKEKQQVHTVIPGSQDSCRLSHYEFCKGKIKDSSIKYQDTRPILNQ